MGDDMPNEKKVSKVLDLENQKFGLEDRIKRLEEDLRRPLEADFNEQASQLSHRTILNGLLKIEKENLQKINLEIDKKKSKTD
jgi:hypothetical protein